MMELIQSDCILIRFLNIDKVCIFFPKSLVPYLALLKLNELMYAYTKYVFQNKQGKTLSTPLRLGPRAKRRSVDIRWNDGSQSHSIETDPLCLSEKSPAKRA